MSPSAPRRAVPRGSLGRARGTVACTSFTGPFKFFLLQPFGILSQMAFTQSGIVPKKIPKCIRQLANFVFVHVWMYYTAPLLVDDFARGGIWLYEPFAISPLRFLGFGAKDDNGWDLWYGLLFSLPRRHSRYGDADVVSFRGPLLFCLLLSFFLSLNARDDQRSLVFSGVFATVWIAEAIVTMQIKLLGGNMYAYFLAHPVLTFTNKIPQSLDFPPGKPPNEAYKYVWSLLYVGMSVT